MNTSAAAALLDDPFTNQRRLNSDTNRCLNQDLDD